MNEVSSTACFGSIVVSEGESLAADNSRDIKPQILARAVSAAASRSNTRKMSAA